MQYGGDKRAKVVYSRFKTALDELHGNVVALDWVLGVIIKTRLPLRSKFYIIKL